MGLILAVDPGSINTGYAVMMRRGRSISVVLSGVIHLPKGKPLAQRLGTLRKALDELLAGQAIEAGAVEDVFTHRNARSALALGQARGVVLAAFGLRGLDVHAYPPATVKRAVAGHGRAEKAQIQAMVRTLLSLDTTPGADEADALAIGLCHLMSTRSSHLVASAR